MQESLYSNLLSSFFCKQNLKWSWSVHESHIINCILPVHPPWGYVFDCCRGNGMDDLSDAGRQNWRSLPIIPATPAHDKMKELLNKRNMTGK